MILMGSLFIHFESLIKTKNIEKTKQTEKLDK